MRRHGDGDDDVGGTAGTTTGRYGGGTFGTSISGGSAGAAAGGQGGTGARGATGGKGGTTSGFGGDLGGGGTGGDSGGGGDAGWGGDAGAPVCTSCGRARTCKKLECGAPWSSHDANGCRRTQCTNTGACPAGERCVPAPVLGRFDDPCYSEIDGCDLDANGVCTCFTYEECAPLALCVPEDEFPPADDCPPPTTCSKVGTALSTLTAYHDGTDFSFDYQPPAALATSVERCAAKLLQRWENECN